MKLTTLFTSSLLLSLAKFASAANLVDQIDSDSNGGLEKVYVNANGDIVIPESFTWGNIAVKEKDAAKPRTCGGHVDASGRLGKRTPTCPYGYAIACDAYAANPCCPVDSPLCCTGSFVCCGTGTFCQGNSTCCLIGQVGCGEACCSYGQVCCGSNCCGAGFTCSASNTCVPPTGYTSSSSSSTTSSSIESSYIYTRSPPIYTTDTLSSNPYGYNPSYTPSSSASSSSVIPTCTGNCTTPPPPPPSNTNTGIVGGVLGAFCIVLVLAAAWLFWKKRHAEHLYAEACAPTKPVEGPTGGGGGGAGGTGGGSYTPEPKPAPTTGYTAPATTYTTPTPAPAPPATSY